jgi:hypothetical protein
LLRAAGATALDIGIDALMLFLAGDGTLASAALRAVAAAVE